MSKLDEIKAKHKKWIDQAIELGSGVMLTGAMGAMADEQYLLKEVESLDAEVRLGLRALQAAHEERDALAAKLKTATEALKSLAGAGSPVAYEALQRMKTPKGATRPMRQDAAKGTTK
jgi:hypothetical protein